MSFVDEDGLLLCPYNDSHRIRASRFPYHLVKCRKNFPGKARNLESCPFNARHRIPKAEMKHHITNCVDQKVIEDEFVINTHRRPSEETGSRWQCPTPEEDWETGLSGGATDSVLVRWSTGPERQETRHPRSARGSKPEPLLGQVWVRLHGNVKASPSSSSWTLKPNEDGSSSPFIFGSTSQNRSCLSASCFSAIEVSNSIPSGVRAPSSFPEQLLSSSPSLRSTLFFPPWRIGAGSKVKESKSPYLPLQPPASHGVGAAERTSAGRGF